MHPSRKPSFVAVLALVAAAALGLGGCTATPVPEPPAATSLDFGRIHGPEVAPTTNVIGIVGEPGAGPPGHTLRVTNLDLAEAPVDVLIGPDGSFALEIVGGQGDELRFHTRQGRVRAAPVDIVWSEAQIVAPERVDCLELVPLQQQDFDVVGVGVPAERTISLDNGCGEAVTVTGARLRRLGSPFAIGPDAPLLPAELAPDEALGWTLGLAAAEPGDVEEIWFLELVVDGDAVRYPITLFGDAR
jgi:hypothetical protein